MRAKIGVLEQTKGLHLPAKFHLNVFIVSASDGQKPQFWANFDIFGAPVPTLFYRRGTNLVCYSSIRLPAKFRLDRFILPSSDGKKNNFCQFRCFLDFGI